MEILCFCHLRWEFVYQRPQHLLARFGATGRVHFWEEPRFEDITTPKLAKTAGATGVLVLVPVLPHGLTEQEVILVQRRLLDDYLSQLDISEVVAWYYTPMALQFSDHLTAAAVVYDCMDELSAFQGASLRLLDLERRLFSRADVVFAGGASLYKAKRPQHPNVHLFASSIDHDHFNIARRVIADPADQADIPHPRIGFYGVLDERLDRDLLRETAAAHPEWHFVLIGPVVKINENDLPHAENLHYLGHKAYGELPSYLANWDVAMLPFARNASTRFISPTKTPEYLVGGKPVVSTPIQDVVKPYGELGLVRIAANSTEFADAIEKSLEPISTEWLAKVDRLLARNSWDKTFEGMRKEIQRVMEQGSASSTDAMEQLEKGGERCLTI